MDRNVKTTDWECKGLAQLTAAFGGGGGGILFSFFSESAGGESRVLFTGGGGGLGGGANGVGLPIMSSSEEERRMMREVERSINPRETGYSRIDCEQEFSLDDLNMSFGRIRSVGASLIVGIGATEISAYNLSGVLFKDEGGFSGVAGVGLGVFDFIGIWKVLN